jgi:hypothetical protein
MVIVKQSLILNAGNGVFTTRNYKKGEFICYYDCIEGMITNHKQFIYSIKCNDKTYIGYNTIRDINGIGQFINDYSAFELSDDDRNDQGLYTVTSSVISNKINNYIKLSQEKSNVIFKNDTFDLFKLYAIRDIETGEELYLHYGIDYWITNIQLTTDEPFTRLYCLLKNNALHIKNSKILLENKIITASHLFNVLHINPSGNIMKHLKLQNKKDIEKVNFIIKMLY